MFFCFRFLSRRWLARSLKKNVLVICFCFWVHWDTKTQFSRKCIEFYRFDSGYLCASKQNIPEVTLFLDTCPSRVTTFKTFLCDCIISLFMGMEYLHWNYESNHRHFLTKHNLFCGFFLTAMTLSWDRFEFPVGHP